MNYLGGVTGIGNRESRRNEITAKGVASERYISTGDQCGVISAGRNFACSIADSFQQKNKLIVESGMLYAYGYTGSLDRAEFSVFLPSAKQYWYLYGEINLSDAPNYFSLNLKNNQASNQPRWRQDNLSSARTGVFQLPLAEIEITRNGIAEIRYLFQAKEKIWRVAGSTRAALVTESVSSATTGYQQAFSDNSKKVSTCGFATQRIAREIDL